jgi:hypothetical protein
MSGQFIVTRGGRESFHTEAELIGLAGRGQLANGDLVYHPVLGRWLYAREVEEIREPMTQALHLGRAVPATLASPPNPEAVAGFILGVLGHLPLIGLPSCLLGIYFSGRGIRRAVASENSGHGLAVAGMVLSLVFLVPATACAAIVLAGVLG